MIIIMNAKQPWIASLKQAKGYLIWLVFFAGDDKIFFYLFFIIFIFILFSFIFCMGGGGVYTPYNFNHEC